MVGEQGEHCPRHCGRIGVHTEEQCAEGRILRWCRSKPRGMGRPVMLVTTTGRSTFRCVVLNTDRGGAPALYWGAAWLEVAGQIPGVAL